MQRKRKQPLKSGSGPNSIKEHIQKFYDSLVQTSLFDDTENTVSDEIRREKEMQQKRQQLDDAESILTSIVAESKTSWVETYHVLQAVDEYHLFEATHKSFSAWLIAYGKKSGISTPRLWNYLKAGRYYDNLAKAREKRGSRLNIEPSVISPDNIAYIKKIAGNDEKKATSLLRQTANGTLGRTQLKKIWKADRSEKESAGKKAVLKNGHDSLETVVTASSMTAGDIIVALDNQAWLPDIIPSKPPYCLQQYLCMPEFPVRTPDTTRHLDCLIAENLTIDAANTNFKCRLHGIEIKISVADLNRDMKMQEYMPFVDDFYLAVPADNYELIVAALERAENERCGLLLINDDHSVEIKKKAIPTGSELREETLMTIVNRTKIK